MLGMAVTLCAGFSAQSAAHAAGLEESLSTIEGLVGQVTNAEEQLEQVRQIYEQAKQAGNVQEASTAEKEIERAEKQLSQSETRLDEARVNALADEAGVSPQKVRELRLSGKGWGVIAKELGVHPSALGKGKAFKDDKPKAKRMQGAQGAGSMEDDDTAVPKGKAKAKSKGKK